MKTTTKTILLSAAIAGMISVAANAQDPNITWGAATYISGTSDVSTQGTLVGTWAPGDDWGGTDRSDNYPVNGVTFAAYGSGFFSGSGFTTSGINDRYNGYANPNTTDPNYNLLLQTSVYSYGSTISVGWTGMTPGDTYQLEFWENDGRSGVSPRSETITGGANTSAALDEGSGGSSNGVGQFILGTFVADSTGDETITINSSAPIINLMELNDITAVPEPSTFALLGGGLCVMLAGIRRKNA